MAVDVDISFVEQTPVGLADRVSLGAAYNVVTEECTCVDIKSREKEMISNSIPRPSRSKVQLTVSTRRECGLEWNSPKLTAMALPHSSLFNIFSLRDNSSTIARQSAKVPFSQMNCREVDPNWEQASVAR
uniref:Uncharacterized protein n=1 Tax=Timema cristinae TaxID=61476 RepID=A0A7R9D311_TIMCR|nr:unnamed protein product [Timema cristinae]